MNPFIKQIIKDCIYKIPSSAILMFHHIGVEAQNAISSCVLSKDNFERLCESYARVSGTVDESIHDNYILSFTFDDGFSDLYETAYPIMSKFGIPFTAFIVESFIGSPGYLTLEQIKEMSLNPNVEIGSHGFSHKRLTELSDYEIANEIVGTKHRLEQLIEKPIKKFAYSHGQFDKRCNSYVSVYDTAYAADSLPLNCFTRKRRYSYPRLNVTDDTFSDFVSYFDRLVK